MEKKQTSPLWSILSVKDETVTFSDVFQRYSSQFDNPAMESLYNVMATLLEHADLLPSVYSRLVCLYILYAMHKNEGLPMQQHPYLSTFLHCYKAPLRSRLENIPKNRFSATLAEKVIAAYSLTDAIPEVISSDTCIIEFCNVHNAEDGQEANRVQQLPQINLNEFEKIVEENGWIGSVFSQPDYTLEAMLKNVNEDDEMENETNDYDSNFRACLEEICEDADALLLPLPPALIFPPPRLPTNKNETVWLNPSVVDYQLAFDATLDGSIEPSPQDIVDSSIEGPLPLKVVEALKSSLDDDDSLILKLNFSASMLPDMVKHNSYVATLLLSHKLKREGNSGMTDYFSVLVGMDMTLNSMEVVNKLTSTCNLPEEFVHMYISNCIKTCEKNKEQHPNFLRRLVRLVCVFLQSLIRNKIIDPNSCSKDLVVEVQCFCIEFSQYKEAAGLFRLLRTFDGGNIVRMRLAHIITTLFTPSPSFCCSTTRTACEILRREAKKQKMNCRSCSLCCRCLDIEIYCCNSQ
eukprot:m.14575 g.14575  ORF g.14575 m.14575 type:complete len:520 (-) comp4334_c0_seq2:63-1622(-)